MPQAPRIVFCKCAYSHIVSEKVTEEVLCALKKAQVAFDVVDDLCGLVATRDKILLQYTKEKHLRIAACYPRAVKSIFHVGYTLN